MNNNQWISILVGVMVTVGVVVAQEVPSASSGDLSTVTVNSDPSVLGSDVEEFKRFEAFRNAQRELAEKERSATTKEAFDEFQSFKQFREMRRAQTQSKAPSSPPPSTTQSVVPVTSPAPKAPSRGTPDEVKPSAPPSTILTDDAATAFSRYRFMHLLENTTHKAVTPATAPLSYGWDWVTTLGLSNITYSNQSELISLSGFSFGFGGRWVFPLATDTSVMVGPELRWVSGSYKGSQSILFGSSYAHKEVKQSIFSLHVPVQIQQRFGRFNVALGGYVSRPLLANEAQVLLSGYEMTNDMLPALAGVLFGGTASVTYNDLAYQLGVYVDLPQNNLLQNHPTYTSRMATYGLFIAARM